MALPDLTNVTLEERRTLQIVLAQLIEAEEQAAAAEERALRESIAATVGTLDALIGPDDAVPGLDSLTAVRKYDAATMGANAGLGLDLAFLGIDVLARAVRDLARVQSRAL